MLKVRILKECGKFANSKNSLNTTDPAPIAEFLNLPSFLKEVEEKTLFFYSALQGAVKNAVNYDKIIAELSARRRRARAKHHS